MEPIEAVMVGAGNRGYLVFGAYAQRNPDRLRFVAVAEPDEARRARFGDAHEIPQERRFASWEDLVRAPRLGQAALNATMDRTHHSSTVALLNAGYHVLLEKPMAVNGAECVDLVRTAERQDRVLQIAHVLRYAPFFRAIYDIVRCGRLGEIVSLDWRENLADWHYAHSYVRGNWSNVERTSPMILTKCCHDLDLLVWYLDRRCERLASFGSLTHFTSDKVGPEIPARCTDGCPIADECPYYAPRIYLTPEMRIAAFNALSLDTSPVAIRRALETGPYGRCVYRCDNTAVDHQAVLMQFEGGLAVTLTMQGASHVEGRTCRIDGTRATLLGDQASNELVLADHLTEKIETIHPPLSASGHGGGDDGVIDAFLSAIRGDRPEVTTTARESVASHLLAFAAEEARLSGRIVEMDAYERMWDGPANS
jgi:predicted dehydrogenase